MTQTCNFRILRRALDWQGKEAPYCADVGFPNPVFISSQTLKFTAYVGLVPERLIVAHQS